MYALEFLLALQVVFTFWSQVGGQYHLDLMFWPWKFGLSLLAAALIVAITAGRAVRRCCLLLVLTIATAGVVTYFYHVNEPEDNDGDDVPTTQLTRLGDTSGFLVNCSAHFTDERGRRVWLLKKTRQALSGEALDRFCFVKAA